jgi:hypothetical protein
LAAACKYQVAGLEQLCENHLAASLCVSNAADILRLADLYEAQPLKTRALQFIASNAKAAVSTEAFLHRLSPALCHEVRPSKAAFRSLLPTPTYPYLPLPTLTYLPTFNVVGFIYDI